MKRYRKLWKMFTSSIVLLCAGAAMIVLGWKFDFQFVFWSGYIMGTGGTVTYFKFYHVNNEK